MQTKTITSASTDTTLDQDQCYRALCAKDSRFDGTFFVGVATTGIYCRPVCRVKTPRLSSCTFYPNASAAEAAGFRPCLRCRPELAPYALQQNLAYAIWQRINAGALNHDGSMQQLALQVGLSPRQLQRLMQSHFGVTPIELAQTARLLFAKKLLQETQLAMAELAYAAGFSSLRRFNALFLSQYGMAPSAIRRARSATANASTNNHAHPQDHLTLRLAYRAPFAWDSMLDYLAGRCIAGVEAIQTVRQQRFYVRSVQLTYQQQLQPQTLQGWFSVSHLVGQHQVEVQIAANLAPVLMTLLARVRQQFDLDANPAKVETHLGSDPQLALQIERTPGLRVPGAFEPFELAIRAVLGQQISVAAATTLSARLVQRFGTCIVTPFDSITHHFPTSSQLALIDVDDLAQIGLPKTRATTVLALARFAAAGGLEIAPGSSLEQTIALLSSVAGIGDWTANYIALRALRFSDAFPAGDLGLQKAAAQGMDGATKKLTAAQLSAHAQRWSPWRGYAALLLWHSLNNSK